MKMDITKCLICDKAMVAPVGQTPICPECEQGEGDLYKKIRQMLRDYPDRRVTVKEAAKMFNVDEKRIKAMIKKGLFTLVANGEGLQ